MRKRNVITPGPARELLVVGVHGTAASDAAVHWAVREARLRRAALHLVLARDPALYRRAPYARATGPDTIDMSAVILAKAARRAARLLPPGWVTSELVDGLPAKVLLDRAVDAELLVLGAARPSGHRADVLGPVAGACLRHAPCPVVIVNPDAWRAPALPGPRIAHEAVASMT